MTMERNFTNKKPTMYRQAFLTESEYTAIMETLAIGEDKYRKELRLEGYSTKYINSAMNKIKNAAQI